MKKENNINYALSNTDMNKLIPYAKFIIYEDLKKYKDIQSALYPHNCGYILYQLGSANSGHWVGVILRDLGNSKKQFEFFDPYGKIIDHFLDYSKYYSKTGIKNYLIELVINDNRIDNQIIFNDRPYQYKESGINTCGKWVCLRIIFKDMSLINFDEKFYYNIPKEFVGKYKRDKYVNYLFKDLI